MGNVSNNSKKDSRPSQDYDKIANLYPYSPTSFNIKGRVTAKFPKKEYVSKKTKQEGQLFSVNIVDDDNNQIGGTFFGKAVDHYYDVIKEGEVYEFSQFSVVQNN